MTSLAIYIGFTACWAFTWVVTYAQSKDSNKEASIEAWSKCHILHDLHAYILCIASFCSLQHWVEESIILSFTLGYFTVDLMDCILRRDVQFFIHAILSIVLIGGSAIHPAHRELRSASKGCLLELSTPFLHRWQRTKGKVDFYVFYALFFLCRIIWLPYFLYNTYLTMGFLEATVACGFVFFFLQLTWFRKLTQMALNYKSREDLQEQSRKKID
mmetsp:Transcript_7183/g.10578  ORF Transcript_7183/g.10578 Transcript_7183/m.10578 type:complete len:215 (+) Transcript_7183:85-729(+)